MNNFLIDLCLTFTTLLAKKLTFDGIKNNFEIDNGNKKIMLF